MEGGGGAGGGAIRGVYQTHEMVLSGTEFWRAEYGFYEQAASAVHAVSPLEAAKKPREQLVQVVEPANGATAPALHLVQLVPSRGANVPGAQSAHALAPTEEVLPAAQLVQLVAPAAAEKVAAGQGTQPAERPSLYLPTAQSRQPTVA